MDWTTLSAAVGPVGTVLAAGAYVIRLEGKTNKLAQMVEDRDNFQDAQHKGTTDRLDRIETKVDKVVDVLMEIKHG